MSPGTRVPKVDPGPPLIPIVFAVQNHAIALAKRPSFASAERIRLARLRAAFRTEKAEDAAGS